MAIFEKFAAELNGGYYCKSGISIADIALFNMVDCHLPLFPIHMTAFPALLAHHKKIRSEKGQQRALFPPVLLVAAGHNHLCATAAPRTSASSIGTRDCTP